MKRSRSLISFSVFLSLVIVAEFTEAQIAVDMARIGCLDLQQDGNLTALVASVCNGRTTCRYKAPTPEEYRRAGVQARTRDFCTQAMDIWYRCGNDPQKRIRVPGDAWNQPPAQLFCDRQTIATNFRDEFVSANDDNCMGSPPVHFLAPRDMLDWTPNPSQGDYTAQGFAPPQPTMNRSLYNAPLGTVWPPNQPWGTRMNSGPIAGAPISTLGANEGRLRDELRNAARKKSLSWGPATFTPLHNLCLAAARFTRNLPASGQIPSDHDFGNAFADLSVTGKGNFAEFVRLRPNENNLSTYCNANFVGAQISAGAMTAALDRAYRVANALRGPNFTPARRDLGWIAVSGEDDQPYRPVNVPTNKGGFPEFHIAVKARGFNLPVNTRYMIAHSQNPPPFTRPAAPLVDAGPRRRVEADPLPALANDAAVILFIHGLDSRLEEADDLTAALHLYGRGLNWTIISMDLPTSGYADHINHERISPISDVACHNTPLVDFVEEFIVSFVDTLDIQLSGQLKPKIKAVVGGSLGGNMAMRLGRRPNTPWITKTVAWSPASIWPSFIAQPNAFAAGCDTSWDPGHDLAVNQGLKWGGLEDRFLPGFETPELRRELFYGAFDWDGGAVVGIFSPSNHEPQAYCWYSDQWHGKKDAISGARLDRQETYDANFRAWHWRLGAEQLAFSHQQFAPGTQEPLYLRNTKPMLLIGGQEDHCAGLFSSLQQVVPKMTNTPGRAQFLTNTGHSLDNEHPEYVAREIANFVVGP
jgi:pimeloyl-ACP methyl ester carboxylesterase